MHFLETIIETALLSAGVTKPNAIVITRPDAKFGDYATSVALHIAKKAGQNPMTIAKAIASELEKRSEIGTVTVAAPGFINITMSDEWLESESILPRHPKPILEGKKFIIEYSSPNIAKPMHVGHLRTTILGQVLVNLFRESGGEVVAWCHPGDWGVQFGKLIVAWQKWGDEKAIVEYPIDELLRVYVKFHQEAREDPKLEEAAKAAFKSLQEGSKELRALWQRFSALSMEEFDRMYVLLGVVFDVWRGESAYNDSLHTMVQDALSAGVAKESEGAVIISLDESGLPPMLIQKSDGATLYATSDLVTIRERVEEVHPDEMIYVVGNEQALHLKQVFAAAEKLNTAGVYGASFELPKLTHVSYGFFRLASGKMSTRQGEVIRLEEVVNQAIAEADTMLAEKNPALTKEERLTLATSIGVGAVKYTDLMHDRHTDVVFDWQKMFSFHGNSIVYLLYTNARCNSLLREAEKETPKTPEKSKAASWLADERELILGLLDFDAAIEKSIDQYDPHHLIDHTYQIASLFNRLYNTWPILKAPTLERARRLQLVRLVQQQLQFLFDTLGVRAPERL